MPSYYPVYVARSDGRLEVTLESGRAERNLPTSAQLDSKPDAKGVCDFYRPLGNDSAKLIDWLRKLGGMLMRELKAAEKGKSYILASLPENYSLYEHLKYTKQDDGKGPNERQDAYLYGHPLGPRKRYRSPADFFPHVLWLATDPTGDSGKCTCKMCSPDEFQAVIMPGAKVDSAVEKPAKEPARQAKSITSSTSANKKRIVSQDGIKSQVSAKAEVTKAPSSRPHEAAKPASPPVIRPASKPSPSPASQLSSSSAVAQVPRVQASLPPVLSREQDVDLQPGQFVFRPGELVWFQKSSAWGLAVVVLRGKYADSMQPERPRYLIQPLSDPYRHPPQRIILDEEQMRPWLAWSAPPPTHQALAGPNLSYNTIDWAAVVQGRAGPGDAEVDGSIFAAKALDESFSLLDPLSPPSVGTDNSHWNGMFLGGEKVWRGDVVRLRLGGGSDVLVVHEILDSAQLGVQVVGAVYTFTSTQAPRPQQVPSNDGSLPLRLQADQHFRNSTTQSTRGTTGSWRLVSPRVVASLWDFKGRWYEPRMLLPVLKGSQIFAAEVASGDIGDAGAWMNARGDAWSTARAPGADPGGTRYATRRDALGRAVPPQLALGRGLDGPEAENTMPAQAPYQPPTQATSSSVVGVAAGAGQDEMAQFMDLDAPHHHQQLQQQQPHISVTSSGQHETFVEYATGDPGNVTNPATTGASSTIGGPSVAL